MNVNLKKSRLFICQSLKEQNVTTPTATDKSKPLDYVNVTILSHNLDRASKTPVANVEDNGLKFRNIADARPT
jgi:hypothetical protein